MKAQLALSPEEILDRLTCQEDLEDLKYLALMHEAVRIWWTEKKGGMDVAR